MDLPVELQVQILSNIIDPFTIYRIVKVCRLWKEIIEFLENEKGLRFRTIKALKRLMCVESLNESIAIQQEENRGFHRKFKEGSILAERAEKVFMTHMEIIRLKYPGCLGRLRHDCKGPPTFGIRMRVSPNPVILLGAGVFLPHGENILTPITFKVSLWMLEDQNGKMKKLIASQTVSLDKAAQFEHSKMCIDYKTGSKLFVEGTDRSLVPEVLCYPGPGHIDRQRKAKRRCLGIHPYPAMFPHHAEVDPSFDYLLTVRFWNCGGQCINHVRQEILEEGEGVCSSGDVETVWGGGGTHQRPMLNQGQNTTFHFKSTESQDMRSSVCSGQIPVIYYS